MSINFLINWGKIMAVICIFMLYTGCRQPHKHIISLPVLTLSSVFQAIIWQLSGSHQAVVRLSLENCQALSLLGTGILVLFEDGTKMNILSEI